MVNRTVHLQLENLLFETKGLGPLAVTLQVGRSDVAVIIIENKITGVAIRKQSVSSSSRQVKTHVFQFIEAAYIQQIRYWSANERWVVLNVNMVADDDQVSSGGARLPS